MISLVQLIWNTKNICSGALIFFSINISVIERWFKRTSSIKFCSNSLNYFSVNILVQLIVSANEHVQKKFKRTNFFLKILVQLNVSANEHLQLKEYLFKRTNFFLTILVQLNVSANEHVQKKNFQNMD